MKLAIKVALACVAALVVVPACAQESKQPWEEYDKLVKAKGEVTALGPTLFGDDVSLYSGGLSFTATDVSLPGNSKLPVAITRKFSVANHKGYQSDFMMADWDLDVPYISGSFASDWVSASQTPNNRCSVTNIGAARPPIVYSGTKAYLPEDYWHGIQANIPGGGGEMMLVNAGVTKPATGTYFWVTSGYTYFSCLPTIQNGPGEGFQAITADGTKYTFDFMAGYVEPMLKGAKPSDPDIFRSRRVLYATRVEDRFGNWVEYTYADTQYYQRPQLTAIEANDGRKLTLSYNGYGHVSGISDGTHTWTYQYDYPTGSQQSLSAVLLPDTSKWTIDFAALFRAAIRYYKGEPGEAYRDCWNPGNPADAVPVVGTITHPSGAVGQFTVAITRFGRSNVPMLCSGVTSPGNDPNDDVSYYPVNWDAFALAKKSVTGPGLTAAEWNYTYLSDGYFSAGSPVCSNGICAPSCTVDSCAGTTRVEVAGPDNTWMRYTFGNSYRYNEGKLQKLEVGTGPTGILKTQVTTYQLAQSGQAYPATIGTSPQPRSDAFDSEYLRPQVANVITQQGVNFSSTVTSFDGFARPLSTTKSSSLGHSKTEVTTYSDNLSLWVLGQVSKLTVNGAVASETGYDTLARPVWHKSFGKLQDTLTYNADGTLATFKDGNNNVTTLSSWYRGVPRSIKHPITPESPTGATETADVDGKGWINWVIDETGSKTCYGYDAMGRLNRITRTSESTPGVCDTTAWNQTTLSFAPQAGIEYGLPGGHWKQTVSTGNARKVIYFDALWRPVVEEAFDNASPTTTRSIVVKRYDSAGRLSYQSNALDALTSYTVPTQGTRTFYDALDRVRMVEQDSELGVLATITDYLPGFQVKVTNPRGMETTTGFFALGAPSYEQPAWILQPEGARTDIARDVFGKPLELKRSGPDG